MLTNEVEIQVFQPEAKKPTATSQAFRELENFFEHAPDNPFGTDIKAFKDISAISRLNEVISDKNRSEAEQIRAKDQLIEKTDQIESDLRDEGYKKSFITSATLINSLREAMKKDEDSDKFNPTKLVRKSLGEMLQDITFRAEEVLRNPGQKRSEKVFSTKEVV